MRALTRNLIALAFGAALISPAAFSQRASGKANQKANVQAIDAISAKATARESQPIKSTDKKTPISMRDEAKSPPGKGNWWTEADTNGDGKISAAEATANAAVNSQFATIDADKDGFLTSEEYREFYARTASQGEQHAATHSSVVTRDVWTRLDADADSKISLAEANGDASLKASFDAMDGNDDGFVTQAEYTAYAKLNK